MSTDAPSPRQASSSFGDDIRHLYFEALRFDGTLASLVAARRAAEAVCMRLGDELPEGLRQTCASKDLSVQITILETNEVAPRKLFPALRTLSAYGNYAAHYEAGTRRAPPDAARSAMASLALVAQWALGPASSVEDNAASAVELREPAPTAPGVFERFRLQRRVKKMPELTEQTESLSSNQVFIDAAAPPAVQFASLMAFYEQSIEVVCGVCRMVLARETTANVQSMTFEQLILSMALVAEARPLRVPRSICLDIETLSRFRSDVAQRLSTNVDAAPFLLEAKTQNVAMRVGSWFDAVYLARSSVERRGLTWLLICGGIFLVGHFARACGHDEGRAEAEAEVQATACGPARSAPWTADAGPTPK